MYPEEKATAVTAPIATRAASSELDPEDLPSSPAPTATGCWSCFPCFHGARARGVQASKKLREWSELIAGPKWKTFIRRFNRIAPGRHHQRQGQGRFHYDPLSYALNFEEQNGGEEGEDGVGFRNFSSRFASVPGSGKPVGEAAVYV